MGEKFFGSACIYLQWRIYIAYTARRSFSNHERKLNIENWNPLSISKGKACDTKKDLIEVFSLEMAESGASERYS